MPLSRILSLAYSLTTIQRALKCVKRLAAVSGPETLGNSPFTELHSDDRDCTLDVFTLKFRFRVLCSRSVCNLSVGALANCNSNLNFLEFYVWVSNSSNLTTAFFSFSSVLGNDLSSELSVQSAIKSIYRPLFWMTRWKAAFSRSLTISKIRSSKSVHWMLPLDILQVGRTTSFG